MDPQRIKNAILFGLLFMFIPMALELFIVWVTPADYWIEYESVVPLHESYSVGEFVRFVSTSEVKRPVQIKWVDTLKCDFADTHGFESQYASTFFYDEPTKLPAIDEKGSPSSWRFEQSAIPKGATRCRLVSNIHVKKWFYEKAPQVIVGDWFDITGN